MTSAIDIERKRTRAMTCWLEQLLTSGHFGNSFNQFPRRARKNGHPVLGCDNYIEPP
jgi:hypothetical protein